MEAMEILLTNIEEMNNAVNKNREAIVKLLKDNEYTFGHNNIDQLAVVYSNIYGLEDLLKKDSMISIKDVTEDFVSITDEYSVKYVLELGNVDNVTHYANMICNFDGDYRSFVIKDIYDKSSIIRPRTEKERQLLNNR